MNATTDNTALDPLTLRRAFAVFPTGVTAVCALVDGEPTGMAANSFTSVSLDPPLVSLAMSRESRSWCRLRTSPRLGISVLAEGQEAICRALGTPTHSGDKFAGVEWLADASGALFVDGYCVALECSIYAEVPAGDHDLVVLRVDELRWGDAAEPMVFQDSRYRRLLDKSDSP